MTSKTRFQNAFTFRWPKVGNFADIKFEAMFIKKISKDSKKSKEL